MYTFILQSWLDRQQQISSCAAIEGTDQWVGNCRPVLRWQDVAQRQALLASCVLPSISGGFPRKRPGKMCLRPCFHVTLTRTSFRQYSTRYSHRGNPAGPSTPTPIGRLHRNLKQMCHCHVPTHNTTLELFSDFPVWKIQRCDVVVQKEIFHMIHDSRVSWYQINLVYSPV